MAVTGTKKRISVIVAVAAVAILGGGVAFAYWTSTGSGTGTAVTGTSVEFDIASDPPVGDPLSPGGPTQTVDFTVTNPGSGSQYLAGIVITVANADGSAWTAVPGCSALDYTIGTPVIAYGEIAPSAVVPGTVTITMNNLPSNQDACKEVTVPLYFLAS